MKLNKSYLFVFLILLITEIMIALFVHDLIIRPFIGDILVIILMYTFIRGFLKKPIKLLPIYLFLFAVAIEIAQYFHLVERLHLQNNKLMATIIGSTFDIKDIFCYLVGAILLIIWQVLALKIAMGKRERHENNL